MFPNIKLARYQLGREPKSELCHPYLRRYETAVLHGQAALREAFAYVKMVSTQI